MKNRFLVTLFLLLLTVGCAAQPAEEAEPAAEPEADSAAMDEASPVDEVRDAYVMHHNAGDAEALAELFAEDAVMLLADGTIREGRASILDRLQQTVASDPTAEIDAVDTMVEEDMAVDIGSYQVQMQPEGAEAIRFDGSYMTVLRNVQGEWKIAGLITNYDSEPPAGLPTAPPPDPETAPEELTDHPLSDVTAAYAEGFAAGDAEAVAALYAEDAWAAFAGMEPVEGREAIAAALGERMAAGAAGLSIHTVGVEELGDGWYVGGGWVEITLSTDDGDMQQFSNWMLLAGTADDGSRQIQWVVTNSMPSAGGEMGESGEM